MIDLKNKVFLDSDGEMTFENKERLNFIMHFMKQGAVEQVATNKDGTFVCEDAEISFNEIWLPCAESKQAEIEVLKTKLAKAQAVPKEPYAYLIKHKLWNKNSQPEIYLADDFVGNDGVEKEKLIVCIPLYKGEDEAQEQSHD